MAKLLTNVSKYPNDLTAWSSLLSFGAAVLAMPERGGATRNLAKIVNRRISAKRGTARTTEASSSQKVNEPLDARYAACRSNF
jgi:hypothetical protein